jgi:uncharacterized protein (DUF2252 family)
MNIVKQVRQFNVGRDPQRLALKYRKLRTDAFSFMRGSCHLFWARTPMAPVLRKAPAVWTCGDLHLENFGSYKADNRQVHFDINDFDESLLAPATWDPLRLLTSILVGQGGLGLSKRQAELPEQLCGVFLDAYAAALGRGKARWVDRDTAPSPVSDLLQLARQRSRPDFLDSRTVRTGKRRQIRLDGIKALPATPQQKFAVTAFMDDYAARQDDPGFFKVLDVAQRIAGTGSLGLDRWIVLVRGKGSPDANHLLDLKAAPASSLAGRVPVVQPVWANEAERIVAVQRRMQAASMAFLHPVMVGQQPCVLRGLQPSEDRVALATAGPDRLGNLVQVMGQCVAWAQLRSSGRNGSAVADELIDFAGRSKWRGRLLELARHNAELVQADWTTYATAYDDGAFKP